MNEQVKQSRRLNRSAVHSHALECSRRLRAGKFVRVSEDFLDAVEADVESMVRHLRTLHTPPLHPPITYDCDPAPLATGELLATLRCEFDEAIRRAIQARVQRHPTCGKTLLA